MVPCAPPPTSDSSAVYAHTTYIGTARRGFACVFIPVTYIYLYILNVIVILSEVSGDRSRILAIATAIQAMISLHDE